MSNDTETRFDRWLAQRPRLDRGYTIVHMRVWGRIHRVQRFLDVRERIAFARWKPGITYLDHGYEPCALIEKDGYGGLTGVSMVDGRVVGGCSIYHCGPEMVPIAEARRVADVIQRMQRGRAKVEQ